MKRSALALGFLLAAAQTFAQMPDPAELVKNPKYASKDIKPTLKKITADELRAGIKVVSGRSSALFGFNSPSVEIHLPRIDNSVYVEDEWETPKLLDKRGRELAFEKEQGLYDHDTFSTEIRFNGSSGKPPEFAKAVGTMTILYPIAMKTVSVKKAEQKKAEALGVEIEGPYVKVWGNAVADAAFGNDIESVRVYDKTGKRLERVMGFSSSGFENDRNYQKWAYHGEVARVDVDVIEERIKFKIAYEMPPAPALPASMAGSPSKASATVPETPGAKFTVTEVAAKSSD